MTQSMCHKLQISGYLHRKDRIGSRENQEWLCDRGELVTGDGKVTCTGKHYHNVRDINKLIVHQDFNLLELTS